MRISLQLLFKGVHIALYARVWLFTVSLLARLFLNSSERDQQFIVVLWRWNSLLVFLADDAYGARLIPIISHLEFNLSR